MTFKPNAVLGSGTGTIEQRDISLEYGDRFYPLLGKLFLYARDDGGYSCYPISIEQLYQHFKARLVSEIVWMVNPQHGRMPCYNAEEVRLAKMHGWTEERAAEVRPADSGAPQAPAARPRGRPKKK